MGEPVTTICLSLDAIRDILTSTDSKAVIAVRHGCSRTLISQIIYGNAYAEVLPEIPRRPPDRTAPRTSRYRKPLSEDAIRDILTSTEVHNVLALRYGRNRSTIVAIRRGDVYAHVLPDIPRGKHLKNCKYCLHWVSSNHSYCDLGFPDPHEEGLKFAADCNTFSMRRW